MNQADMRSGDFLDVRHRVYRAPVGHSLDDVLSPGYWLRLRQHFRVGDVIDVVAADESFEVSQRLMEVDAARGLMRFRTLSIWRAEHAAVRGSTRPHRVAFAEENGRDWTLVERGPNEAVWATVYQSVSPVVVYQRLVERCGDGWNITIAEQPIDFANVDLDDIGHVVADPASRERRVMIFCRDGANWRMLPLTEDGPDLTTSRDDFTARLFSSLPAKLREMAPTAAEAARGRRAFGEVWVRPDWRFADMQGEPADGTKAAAE